MARTRHAIDTFLKSVHVKRKRPEADRIQQLLTRLSFHEDRPFLLDFFRHARRKQISSTYARTHEPTQRVRIRTHPSSQIQSLFSVLYF